MRKISRQIPHVLMALLFAVVCILVSVPVQAAPLNQRSVTVASPLPSANTSHTFRFTIGSITNVGSIEFEYCTNSPFVGTPCTAPVGFDATGAVLATQTGETGFSIDASSTINRIVLTRASVPTAAIPVLYRFNNVINQNTTNTPVYVRISTFASVNGTGPRTDDGAVAYSTSSAIAVSGYVPPYLTFCVGVTVALNCSSMNGVLLNFGELVPNQPRFVSSQFSVATNDPGGYNTFVSGPTMTSGNNIIPGLNVPAPSLPGISQFGMNLRANSNPAVGAEPSGVGSGVISAGFNVPNQFYFNNQVIASSAISSDFNAFTVSYLVNVNENQRPGIYSTTLTYIAVAAF